MVKKAKGKKKGITVVAPEPPLDDVEAVLKWNRVLETGGSNTTAPTTVSTATSNPLNIAVYDVSHSDQGLLFTNDPYPNSQRAVEHHLEAESRVRAAQDEVQEAKFMLEDFDQLHIAESAEIKKEKQRIISNLNATLVDFDALLSQISDEITGVTNCFLDEKESVLSHVRDLILGDIEIEKAFEEREHYQQKCQEEMDLFFQEQRAHVSWVEAKQSAAADAQQKALAEMTKSLQNTIKSLFLSVFAQKKEGDANESRSLLITELSKLEKETSSAQKWSETSSQGLKELHRLIKLESDKLQLSTARRETLQKQIESLNDTLLQQQKIIDQKSLVPRSETERASTDYPTLLIAAKNELEQLNEELLNMQENVDALRNMQNTDELYRPVSFPDDVVPTERNSLDHETNVELRSVVVRAFLEIIDLLHVLDGDSSSASADANVANLATLSVEDRRAVQNYVAKSINAYFQRKGF
ncbi:hypothetical protein STCU_10956 [Strigomonas culicis]|uniref:Uncharacterized protein n=1 Tax=Strigomonas culicis TaxID=28005 RepID=S9TKH5_9TRYP|nr:hypothetical protein STCU_10956 [Strigomonas culicis]|eukprot:EPY16843.1 hypothetical protein STCU_10956 [Strigomonas culicis]